MSGSDFNPEHGCVSGYTKPLRCTICGKVMDIITKVKNRAWRRALAAKKRRAQR